MDHSGLNGLAKELNKNGRRKRNREKVSKLERQENKRRKIAALLNVSALNEADRQKHERFARGCTLSDVPEIKKRKRKLPGSPNKPILKRTSEKHTDIPFREFNDVELAELRKLLIERRQKIRKRPKLFLQEMGRKSSIDLAPESRIPLFLTDLQHLILYSLHGHMSVGQIPRWVRIEKTTQVTKTVLLVIEGVSLLDYIEEKEKCESISAIEHKLEIITPLAYGGNLAEELATIPLTNTQKDKFFKKFGSLKQADKGIHKLQSVLRTVYPFTDFKTGAATLVADDKNDKSTYEEDKFPRSELLLSPWQMVEEGYPIPLKGEMANKYASFVYTKEKYTEVTDMSPMYGLDCEMCLTRAGSELTRVSVVNEKMEIVYSSLVKPHNPIIDYVTRYSGITATMLSNVWTRLEDVQNKLREILPSNVILVGHSLNFDLIALKMMHPYVIDTSIIFNLSGEKFRKTKLRVLASEFLNFQIQKGAEGHNPTEDAAASLKLVLAKLSKSFSWGNAILSGVRSVEEAIAAQHGVKSTSLQVTHRSEPDDLSCIKIPEAFEHAVDLTAKRTRSAFTTNLLTTSIISKLIAYEKKALIVAKEPEANIYRSFMPESSIKFKEKSRAIVTSANTNRMVVKLGRNNSVEPGTTIMHVTVNSIIKADKLIGKLMKNLGDGNVLALVLLAGRKDDTKPSENHGLLLVNFRKEILPPVRMIGRESNNESIQEMLNE